MLPAGHAEVGCYLLHELTEAGTFHNGKGKQVSGDETSKGVVELNLTRVTGLPLGRLTEKGLG